ncbi:MAG: AAA family ATPase [Patescibacteria group bacterium]
MPATKLILIDGPAGVGKTTICERLSQDFPDIIWQNVDELKIPFRESSLGFSRSRDMPIILEKVKELIKNSGGKHLLIDEAFAEEVFSMIDFAKKIKVSVLPIYLQASLENVMLRNNQRGKVKDNQKIIDTWNKSQTVLSKSSVFTVVDANGNFDKTYSQILRIVTQFYN